MTPDWIHAATSSRLPPATLTKEESGLLHKDHLNQEEYLSCRNHILHLWLLNPTHHITLDHVLSHPLTRSLSHNVTQTRCLHLAFAFLHRYRYINFGKLMREKFIL